MLRRSLKALLFVVSLVLTGCSSEPKTPETAQPTPRGIDPSEIETRPPLAPRLFILALDGATWEILDPLLDAGRLPNLAGLIAAGVRADLKTLEPTVSPAIWTTIATGFLPERHGILGFEGVPGATMTTLPNAGMRRVKAYWNILSDFGRTSATIGWWASWPADELGAGSVLVSDRVPYTRMEAATRRASLDAGDTFPVELIDRVGPLVLRPGDLGADVARRFLGIEGDAFRRFLESPYEMGSYLPEFKFVYQSDRSTLLIAHEVLREAAFDVAAVYFTGIDTVSHLFWHFAHPEEFPSEASTAEERTRLADVIDLYCEAVDRNLGELLADLPDDTTVLVVSDHGFGGTGQLPWSGGHGRLTPGAPIAPAGVLVLAGPGIRADAKLERAHVLDVVPTILHLMGIPASEEMLGQALVDALDPSLPEPLERVPSLETIGTIRSEESPPVDPRGDAERLDRLRALGYIE